MKQFRHKEIDCYYVLAKYLPECVAIECDSC